MVMMPKPLHFKFIPTNTLTTATPFSIIKVVTAGTTLTENDPIL